MKDINFNDLPCDIKSMIYSINKEAEKKEHEGVVVNHLKGKIHIQPKIKHYNWLNCVSCGEDISKINIKHYHFCRGCYDKYCNPLKRTDVWRSRPMALDRNKMPIVINGSLYLKPNYYHQVSRMCLIEDEINEEP